MIVWLASYPKSGNTWVRIFISTLLYSSEKTKVDINKQHLKQFPNRSNFKNLTNNFLNLDELSKKKNSLETTVQSKATEKSQNKEMLNTQQMINVSNENQIDKTILEPGVIKNSKDEIKQSKSPKNFSEMLNLLLKNIQKLKN